MPKRLLVPLLVTVGIAVTATGCGSDGAARTVAASSLTRAEFAKRAEAICARGRLRGLRYGGPRGARQSERDALAERIEVALLPAIQRAIDEIYALGAPLGEEDRVEALLIALQEAVGAGKELRVPSFERLEQLFAKSGRLARKEGLDSCAYG